jgi:hypothetical protein
MRDGFQISQHSGSMQKGIEGMPVCEEASAEINKLLIADFKSKVCMGFVVLP